MLLIQLLQITTETQDPLAQQSEEAVMMIDLLLKGGLFIIPLFILSVIAVYIIVERGLTIKSASKNPDKFMNEVKNKMLSGDISGAKAFCETQKTPMSRMIVKGITRIGGDLKSIEAAIENVGKLEIYRLEKNLSTLATISGAAPMIGFLGTVTGMIQAFIAIAQEEGNVSPKLLSAGIYEAMITTVAGLAVGIVAYIGYNYLVAQVQKVIHKMEYTSIDFIDLLQEPSQS